MLSEVKAFEVEPRPTPTKPFRMTGNADDGFHFRPLRQYFRGLHVLPGENFGFSDVLLVENARGDVTY